MRHTLYILMAALLVLMQPGHGNAEDRPVTVFAAASTQQAVERVLRLCPELIGQACRGVFAASSTLARQIAGGAPADLYISANLKWMRYLVDNANVEAERVQVLATNRLVVVVPKNKPAAIEDEKGLLAWLARDRIAVGDPAHVPAGIYTEQTLRALGAWEQLQGKLLRMPNVRAALAVVARAEADAGIVYETDAAISGDVAIAYRFARKLHDPIRYPMAPLAGRESEAVRKLVQVFAGEDGKSAFRAAGFEVAAD